MRCPACNAANSPGRRFCASCGVALAWRCADCGFGNEAGSTFCGGCGRGPAGAGEDPQGAASPSPPVPAERRVIPDRAAPMAGERKRISVLFADIVGSTALVEGLDAEAAVAQLQPALAAMVEAVHRFEGTVNKIQGDGLTALFGAPIAREDHAYRACAAALAMHKATSALANRLRLRVGVNTGEVVLRTLHKDLSTDYDAGGPVVHLAARMEQLAEPGMTCLTTSTLAAAVGRIETTSLGTRSIRGISKAVDVFALEGLVRDVDPWSARASVALSRFTGRDREMAVLRWAIARSRQGAGQVVALCGEAGVGKSRLAHEIAQEALAEGWRLGRAAAQPETRNTALAPFASLCRRLLGLSRLAPQTAGSGALREMLEGLGLSASLPAFAALLDTGPRDPAWTDLAPESRRQQLFQAMLSLLRSLAEEQPLLLVFEDLHWVDRETQAALDSLVEGLAAAPILVIATYRPEYQTAWSGKAHHRSINLAPLSGGGLAAFVAALIGEDPSLEDLAAQVAARTGGLPLFVEETVRALQEAGILEGLPGDFRLLRAPDWSEVPGNVRDLIASRIDRLPAPSKALLQSAAVIGESGLLAILQRICGQQSLDFDAAWPDAAASELIRLDRGAEGRFTFKHALVRDVAYMSLLTDRRRKLHLEIIQAMETMLGSAFEEHLPNLAAHAMAGEAWEKAADAAFRAGERAIDRSAYRDAASLFEMVLKALEKLPPQPDFVATAIDVRLRLRSSLHQDGNIDRIDTYLAEAEGLARSIEDKRRLALVNLHRSYVLSTAGKMPGALLAAEQALSLGKDLDDQDLIAEARLALGQANVMGGRFAVAFEVLKDLPQLFAGPRRGRRFGQMATRSLWCIALMSEALLGLSQFDEALRMAERAHGEAMEINRPLDITWAAKFLGNALMAQGRAGEAQEILRSGLALAQAYDIRLIQPWLALGLGHAAMLEGDAAASETWLAHAEALAMQVELHICCAYVMAARAALARRAARDDLAEELAMAAGKMFQELGVEKPLVLTLG